MAQSIETLLLHTILSYEPKNVMLAAVLSLILVLIFVILLHIYARCFLTPNPVTGDGVSASASAPVVPFVLGARFYRLHNLLTSRNTITNDVSPPVKGLESSIISSIPKFVYKAGNQGSTAHGLACVICLSLFEDEEVGRKLQCCHHAFHVECIDMWLYSHTTCPICRSSAVKVTVARDDDVVIDSSSDHHEINIREALDTHSDESSVLDIVVECPNTENGLNDTRPSSNDCA